MRTPSRLPIGPHAGFADLACAAARPRGRARRQFETYLLRVVGGSAYRAGHKQGFCLGDDYDTATGDLPGKPAKRVYSNDASKACGARRPRALSVRLGVSVGWGDSYAPYVEGQYVDVTGLPAGTYRLVNEVDRAHTLSDADFSDNVSAREVELAWPDGPGRSPAITPIGTCFSRETCASPLPTPPRLAARASVFERTGSAAGAAALLER